MTGGLMMRMIRRTYQESAIMAVLVGLVCLGAPASAEALDFSFTGSFIQDDDVQLFNFTVGIASTVTLRTYSYAGGTNAAGTVIPSGGFDPILALFNSSGVLIGQNDDGNTPDVPIDPVTANHYDTLLQSSPGPGGYTVSVMQFE